MASHKHRLETSNFALLVTRPISLDRAVADFKAIKERFYNIEEFGKNQEFIPTDRDIEPFRSDLGLGLEELEFFENNFLFKNPVKLFECSEIKYYDNVIDLLKAKDNLAKHRVSVDDQEFAPINENNFRVISPNIIDDLPQRAVLSGLTCYALIRLYDSNYPLAKGTELRMSNMRKAFKKLGLADVSNNNGVVDIAKASERRLLLHKSVTGNDLNRSGYKLSIAPELLLNLTPKDFENSDMDVCCSRPTLMVNAEACKMLKYTDAQLNVPREFVFDSVESIKNCYVVYGKSKVHYFVLTPCGRCYPCMEKKKATLSVDVKHEMLSQMYRFKRPVSCFLTLTYAPEYLENNCIKDEHFISFRKSIRDYFNLARKNKYVEQVVTLNKHKNAAYIRNHPFDPKAAFNAQKLYPMKAVRLSKTEGLVSKFFEENDEILNNGTWYPEDFLKRDFNILGVSEYGSKHGHRHFHAIVVGVPEFMYEISQFADFTEGLSKTDAAPSDELVALFQSFWPYGDVECRCCYGKAEGVAKYVSKYVGKQMNDVSHEVAPNVYYPKRAFGRNFVDVNVENYNIRNGLKYHNLSHRCQNVLNLHGRLFTYPNVTGHNVESAEKSLSRLMPTYLRNYVNESYLYSQSNPSNESYEMLSLIESFYQRHHYCVRKLFTSLAVNDDGEPIYDLPRCSYKPFFLYDGYTTDLKIIEKNSGSLIYLRWYYYNHGFKRRPGSKYDYIIEREPSRIFVYEIHKTKRLSCNKRYFESLSSNILSSIGEYTYTPYDLVTLTQVIDKLESILSAPAKYCSKMSNEEYYHNYYMQRTCQQPFIPEPTTAKLDKLIRNNNKQISNYFAKVAGDNQ